MTAEMLLYLVLDNDAKNGMLSIKLAGTRQPLSGSWYSPALIKQLETRQLLSNSWRFTGSYQTGWKLASR
jgi:hypothetical protein